MQRRNSSRMPLPFWAALVFVFLLVLSSIFFYEDSLLTRGAPTDSTTMEYADIDGVPNPPPPPPPDPVSGG
ncbi:MAG: hypothetical protein ACE5H0_08425 [Bacteroidota bacterium]